MAHFHLLLETETEAEALAEARAPVKDRRPCLFNHRKAALVYKYMQTLCYFKHNG